MKKITVKLRRSPDDEPVVGTLAEQDHRIYFEYDAAFIESGLQLSPYKLPLRSGLIEHTDRGFGPLPGIFDDSLPDGWGLLLMDRHFRRAGSDPATRSPLDRLVYLGNRTMGALTYHPPRELEHGDRPLDLFDLGENAEAVLKGDAAEVLPQMMRAGGSPAGARPKALVGVRGDQILSGESDLPQGFEHWMVKFAARADARNAGPVEYAYSRMARAAGVHMPDTRLFKVGKGPNVRRYFGVRRFDRDSGNRRFHVHSFANLIHADFRFPSTDYADLFKVTRGLTRNHADVVCLFRLMLFNVAAHNRDDHGKNFSFLLDDRTGQWSLAPAFDLTFAVGPGGEQTMTVNGEGRQITAAACIALAVKHGIKSREADTVLGEVNEAVARWAEFADEAGVSKNELKRIGGEVRPL